MKSVKIEFSTQQLSTLNAALVELPYRQAAPLIAHINAEIQKAFNDAASDAPTGQTTPPDQFAGD